MTAFEKWGRWVFRRRWWVFVCSLVSVLLSAAALAHGGHLLEKDSVPTEASQADALITRELHQGPPTTDLLLVFSSRTLTADDGAFGEAMSEALAPLTREPHVAKVVTPFTSAGQRRQLISRDRHRAIADVVINDGTDNAKPYYPQLRALVHSSILSIDATGDLAVNHDYNQLLDDGLARSGSVALPLSLLLLALAFGTILATVLPLAVGILTIAGATGAAFMLSQFTLVSPATTEFISFLGLGLAIDYALFIVNRFREELNAGHSVEDSLAVTMATTGRAVVFSGLTVMAGLSGLFFFRGTWLGELAAPLVLLVALAVIYGATLLPASLALLGHRIDALRLPGLGRWTRGGFWHRLSNWVMRRPWLVLLPALAAITVMASPLAHIDLATDHGGSLPASAESRRGSEAILSSFPQFSQATIPVVIRYPDGQPLSTQHGRERSDLARRLWAIPGVVGVDDGRQSAGSDISVLSVTTNQQAQSEGARQVVRAIRTLSPGAGAQMLVTGDAAYDMDRTAWIIGRVPLALGFVAGTTFVILLLLFGSVILPIKAVLTNLMSISVAFGAMVWIFQDGHLASLLNFTPIAIDPTVPVAMFCVVFGLSMDYEVFLLTRIQEEYMRSGDNARAVAQGLERSGRLVTFAAAIMVAVVGAFALGDVTVIKMVGLGTAIAIAVDATLMRGLIVPAALVIMRRANWWAPHWLDAMVDRLGVRDAVSHNSSHEPRAGLETDRGCALRLAGDGGD